MSKLSDKTQLSRRTILLSLLLALFLWGGVVDDSYAAGLSQAPQGVVNAANQAESACADVEVMNGPTAYQECLAKEQKKAQSVWDDFTSSILSFLDLGAGIMTADKFTAISSVVSVWSALQSVFLAVSAALMNGMLIVSIEKFPSIVEVSQIQIAWSVFRNLINISFIFILLYISISMIIGSVGPKAKSTIAQVIIAALLINFSLFFTKIMIDASNLIAVALYNYTGNSLSSFGTLLMKGLGIQSVWSWKNLTISGQISTLFMLSLQLTLMISLTWSYLRMAFLLIGRMVTLLILMALSPVAFLGGAVPGLGDKASEWWKAFTGQLMVAPAFAFILIIVAKLLEQQEKVTSVTKGLFKTDGAINSGIDIGPIIYYILIIAILSHGVKMVKKLSGNVGEIMDKITKGAKALGMAAVVAGAAVATGGATLAANGARLGMAGAAKKIITGDLDNEHGVFGMTGRFARSKFMQGTKEISQGKVDLKKIETDYKKEQKDEISRIMKKADSVGPSKAIARKKTLEDTLDNVDQYVQTKKPDLAVDIEMHKQLKKDLKEAEIKVKRAEAAEAVARTAEEKAKAKTNTDNTTKERNDLKSELANLESKLAPERQVAAKAMGADYDAIKTELSGIGDKIKEGIEKKNQFIVDFSKLGPLTSGIVSAKKRQEVVDNIRATQKYSDDEGDLKKLFKKLAKEDEKEDKKSDKKDETK